MAGKGSSATALIVALAKQKAKPKKDRDADVEACAEDILSAIKTGSKAGLAKALRAFSEVSSAPADE